MKLAVVLCCALAACTSETNLGYTPVGAPRWAIALGGTHDDVGIATAIDSIGDVIAAGEFHGPVDFGSGPVATNGPWSFVTKRVASDGSERWTQVLLGSSSTSYAAISGIAIDHEDDVIVTGSYQGTVDFGGQTLTPDEPTPPAYDDLFVAKYAADGHLIWVRGLAPRAGVFGQAIAIDAADRIFVAGDFTGGTLDLGGHTSTEPLGVNDGFLVAFDPAGALLWGHAFEGTDGGAGPYAQSIALAPNGDVVVAGVLFAPGSVGGAVLDPQARERAFAARFRGDGLYLWSRALGAMSPGTSAAMQVAMDAAGHTVVQTSERATDMAYDWGYSGLYVLDDAGHDVWSEQIANDGASAPQIRTLTTTPSGLILSSAWDDVPTGPTGEWTGAMKVASYDPSGRSGAAAFGQRTRMGPQLTMARSSAAGPDGSIAFTGTLTGALDFGTGTLTAHGMLDTDVFLVVVDPPGHD